MTERALFDWLLWGWTALAVVVFIALFFVSAPYGRHSRPGWGPSVPPRLGWFLMETPSWVVLTACLLARSRPVDPVAGALYAVWVAHYVYRSMIYPLTIDPASRRMPLAVAVMGGGFNLVNAYLNGRWLFEFGPVRPVEWLWSAPFVAGIALMVLGFALGVWSDRILRQARAASGGRYVVPSRGLYSLVSCPNYLGEILEWAGFAFAAWSLPGLSFALWTVANLAPRAASHHRWYRATFAEYPANRRRLVPFVL